MQKQVYICSIYDIVGISNLRFNEINNYPLIYQSNDIHNVEDAIFYLASNNISIFEKLVILNINNQKEAYKLTKSGKPELLLNFCESLYEKNKKKKDELGKLYKRHLSDLIQNKQYQTILEVCVNLNRYSFKNAIIINSQLPSAKELKTYDEWNKQGREIKKHEKAIYIFAINKVDNKEYINAIPVFDISQTYIKGGNNNLLQITHNSINYELLLFALSSITDIHVVFSDLDIKCKSNLLKLPFSDRVEDAVIMLLDKFIKIDLKFAFKGIKNDVLRKIYPDTIRYIVLQNIGIDCDVPNFNDIKNIEYELIESFFDKVKGKSRYILNCINKFMTFDFVNNLSDLDVYRQSIISTAESIGLNMAQISVIANSELSGEQMQAGVEAFTKFEVEAEQLRTFINRSKEDIILLSETHKYTDNIKLLNNIKNLATGQISQINRVLKNHADKISNDTENIVKKLDILINSNLDIQQMEFVGNIIIEDLISAEQILFIIEKQDDISKTNELYKGFIDGLTEDDITIYINESNSVAMSIKRKAVVEYRKIYGYGDAINEKSFAFRKLFAQQSAIAHNSKFKVY